VIATAKDKAHNVASTATTIFWIDTTAPATATITSPAHNATVGNLNSVTGTASDAGSGIARVDLRIKRLSDNFYWSGTTWVAALTNLTTTLIGSDWSRNTAMPTGASLPNGLYTLTASAVDKANLSKAAVATVNVKTGALQYQIEASSSPNHLVSAQWSGHNVQLTFSAPLDAASLPTAQFALALNGAELQAQSISCSGSTVTISLPSTSLPPDGATLTVEWDDLQDASGALLSGQTSLIRNSE
jgi:hypothetical protein